jgi:drug/metabolite transporter (DMT)-like permease
MRRLAARTTAWTERLPPVLRGMALILLSTFGFSGMHAVIRVLSQDLHAFEIAFFRNLFGLIVLTPFLARHGVGALRTRQLPLHALRGCIQIGAMLMFFTAVTITPLAKVSAMSFTAPLFATVGAVIFLGEPLRGRRIAALLIGFAGALVILQPGVVAIDLGAALVLVSSALWAVAMLIIKRLSRSDSSITISAYMVIFLTPLSFGPALWVWQWPAPAHYLLFLAMGAMGSLAHVAMAQAFKEADASAILPLDFTRLLWAALLGLLLFGEVPELATWIGGITIFASTTYIAIREARAEAAKPVAAAAAESKPPS